MSNDRTVILGDTHTLMQRAMDVSRQVIDMRLLSMDPIDTKGMPFYNPETKEIKWAKPAIVSN